MLKPLLARIFSHEFRQRIKRKLFVVRDIPSRLRNLKRAGFVPNAAIDGGCFRGGWSEEFWDVWPNVPVLMVEPQPQQRDALQRLAQRVSGSSLAACALGAKAGKVQFQLGDSASSVAATHAGLSQQTVEVELRTLDQIVDQWKQKPNFLKLDLQGYELEALRGGMRMLADVEVILIEISLLKIGEVPIFNEVDQFLQELGFQIYDIVPQYYRPLDGALWQIDALYVRKQSALLASRAWA